MRAGPGTARRRHRRILGLAVPAVGTLVADPLLGAVDTAVAGRLGSTPLAALGLAVGVLTAGTWVFNFLQFGTTTTVAQAVGRGDLAAAGRGVAHAAAAAVALGVLASVILFALAPLVVVAVGAVEELVDPAVTYLRIRAIGAPFLLLGFVGHGAFRGVGDTRTPLLVVVAANVLNAGLDLLLVFGLGLGLAGIAAATLAAEVAAVLVLALLIRRAGLPLTGHGLPDRAQVRDLLVVSRDLLLRTAGLVGGFLAITAAAARTDAVTAAAHQVIWQVFILVAFVLDGFAIAGQAIIGNALGARDERAARQVVADLAWWGLGAGVVVALVLWWAQAPVVGAFTDDPAVAAAVSSAWLVACLAHPISGLAFVLDGVVMGAADFAYLRRWTVTAALVGGVAAQVGVSLGGGLRWLWVCMAVLLVIRAVSLGARMRGTAWLRSDLAR